ncbi:putative L-cystine transporter [Papiliotrema laurentii]|uniref:L-cystine transporter n=1 Tax=Papiliotrema laurentii TaxID=5418 RepID=A0AAD9FQ70_PAPLA|nr:putative L-cystine transporter [Papiliotrema laurentii]
MLGHDTGDSGMFVNALVALTGVGYFTAWSVSFYPQLILNHRRKRTTGLSADFIIINPVGFLALTIWNWGVYFSPLAQKQYKARHDGHRPQISVSDLAFSLHALVISILTLAQVVHYAWREKKVKARDGPDESSRLLDQHDEAPRGVRGAADLVVTTSTIRPSVPFQLGLIAIAVSAFVSAGLVWTGRAEWLDWLYFISTIKLIISLVKYIPQVLLNYRLKSAEGFATSQVVLDLTGSFLSFAQLVISSIWVEHDPSGIIANPSKLGLSFLSVFFDVILITQKHIVYPQRRGKRLEEVEEEEEVEAVER